MYIAVDVQKPAGISPGSAAPKKNQVIIIDVEDILVYPNRDSSGVNMVGNFVLKPNAKMIKFYVTKSKVSAPWESDGDEDSISIKQSFECQSPGNELPLKEFTQNWLGRNVVIIHESCADNFKEVVGTPCAPLQMKPSKHDSNDGRYITFKFEQFAKSAYLPGHYTGNYVVTAPTAVTDASAIGVDTAVNTQYALPATSAVVVATVDVVAGNHGETITLIGNGGTSATTLATDTTGSVQVILKDGITWVALENATLHLQIFKAAATTYLMEVART